MCTLLMANLQKSISGGVCSDESEALDVAHVRQASSIRVQPSHPFLPSLAAATPSREQQCSLDYPVYKSVIVWSRSPQPRALRVSPHHQMHHRWSVPAALVRGSAHGSLSNTKRRIDRDRKMRAATPRRTAWLCTCTRMRRVIGSTCFHSNHTPGPALLNAVQFLFTFTWSLLELWFLMCLY